MKLHVVLLLSLVACTAFSQSIGFSRSRCLCRRVREMFRPLKNIHDIQIYPPSSSCTNMEIVVSLKNGLQYCLDPTVKKVQELIANIKKIRKAETEASTKEP